jgi:DNA-binding NarL/FixJ family response regulator
MTNAISVVEDHRSGREQPPALDATLLRQFATTHRLSHRETQVLERAVHGLCMKQSADELGLSVKTVENYWTRIYHKTGQSSQLGVLAGMLRWLASSLTGSAG